jgi:hypothetical protein
MDAVYGTQSRRTVSAETQNVARNAGDKEPRAKDHTADETRLAAQPDHLRAAQPKWAGVSFFRALPPCGTRFSTLIEGASQLDA